MSVVVAIIAAVGRRCCWLWRRSTGSASEPSTAAPLTRATVTLHNQHAPCRQAPLSHVCSSTPTGALKLAGAAGAPHPPPFLQAAPRHDSCPPAAPTAIAARAFARPVGVPNQARCFADSRGCVCVCVFVFVFGEVVEGGGVPCSSTTTACCRDLFDQLPCQWITDIITMDYQG